MQHAHSQLSSANFNSAQASCRRCGQVYARPAGRLFLASCPHCGTSVRPLWGRLRDNRLAAIMAFFAIPALTAGVLVPFISMSQVGETRAYSLLGGIGELYRHHYVFLAGILLVFSVIFPYAKLVALLVATSRLIRIGPGARRRLHHLAKITGRYSLLDLLVVAILIVVVRFQGVAEAKALAGTYLFAAAVFLSIWAGICVNLDGLEPSVKEGRP